MADIRSFKREHELSPADAAESEGTGSAAAVGEAEEQDLRAEDDALVAAALEAEAEQQAEEASEDDDDEEAWRTPTTRTGRAGGAAGGEADAGAGAARGLSRGRSTTARRATACGSTRRCRTTPCTPNTGPGTGRWRYRWSPTGS